MLRQKRLLCIVLAFLVFSLRLPTEPVNAATGTPTPTVDNTGMAHEDFTVKFDDFTTKAQLTYPASGDGPFPTVILLPSFGLTDMDNRRLGNPNDSPTFLQIAQYLAQHGIAAVRFNKHYVNSIMDEYPVQIATLTFKRLYADAESVYTQTIKNPKVDSKRIVIWGWGESSSIAAYLATQHKEIAGLILQSPMIGTFKDNYYANYNLIGLPYIRQYVDANHDGKISFSEANDSLSKGDRTELVKQWAAYLMDFQFANGRLTGDIKATIDTNHDKILDIDQEIEPYFKNEFARFYDETDHFNPFGLLLYRSDIQFPSLIDSVEKTKQPILILQGGNDALVPASNAKYVDNILTSIDHPDHTLILAPGLGHSLSLVYSIMEDKFGPMEPHALDSIGNWLDSHFGNP